MNFIATLAKILLAPTIFVMGLAGYHFNTVVPVPVPQAPSVGATIPIANDFYSDSLQSRITPTATSFTLVSGVDGEGNSLSGEYGFTIDQGSSVQEIVLCSTVSGVNVSGCTRGIDLTTGTSSVSSLEFIHNRGASVQITTAPIVNILANIMRGVETIPQPIMYDPSVASSTIAQNGNYLASVNYVNFVGSTGCANATSGARGCIQLSTAVQAASSTATGSTGASLVIPASIATSSNQVIGLHVPITQNNGYINWNFLDLTQPLTFSGLDTFNTGGLIVNASSTFTSSLSLSTITSKILKTNSLGQIVAAVQGQDYMAEQITGATSTATSTGTISCSGTGCGTIFSTPMPILTFPAGTLSASSTIEVNLNGSCSGSQSLATYTCGSELLTNTGAVIWADNSFIANVNGTYGVVATTVSTSTNNQISLLTGASANGSSGSSITANAKTYINFSTVTGLSIAASATVSAAGGDSATSQGTIGYYTVIVRP